MEKAGSEFLDTLGVLGDKAGKDRQQLKRRDGVFTS